MRNPCCSSCLVVWTPANKCWAGSCQWTSVQFIGLILVTIKTQILIEYIVTALYSLGCCWKACLVPSHLLLYWLVVWLIQQLIIYSLWQIFHDWLRYMCRVELDYETFFAAIVVCKNSSQWIPLHDGFHYIATQTCQLSLIQSETQAMAPSKTRLQSDKNAPISTSFILLLLNKILKILQFFKSYSFALSEVGRSVATACLEMYDTFTAQFILV